MATLSLALFGSLRIALEGQPLSGFRTSKVQALLIYLAIEDEPDQEVGQRRDTLLSLLWPGMPDRSARRNLRQIIYHLRMAIPDLPPRPKQAEQTGRENVPLLLVNRQSLRLNPEADYEVDARRFESLIEGTHDHEHVDLLVCHQCYQDLESAMELYQGDFLADFYLEDSNEFEDWAQIRRDTYRRKALDALEIMTTVATRQKDYSKARVYAERQLEIDDLRETAYRQLMEVLALSGQRAEALATYERCRRYFIEELGMEPASRTTEVYEKIRVGDLSFEVPLAQGVRGYELKEEIGEGAYGAIHRAVHPAIGREVAIKVIRLKYANDPEFIRRFEAEAQTIARLEHPYIVPLYDYWRDPVGAYLVMRFLRGGSLLTSLQEGPWDVGSTVKMLDQVGGALSAAHRQGVVHRDIKPANILLDEGGNAYLSDFGIAKSLTSEVQLTAAGAFIGTPDYVSPEQIKNDPVSGQTDIYSLGAVLYETLTGEKPFSDSSVANLIYKHLTEPVPLVTESRPDLPSSIDEVIQRATAKRPADRYSDALEIAEEFQRAVQGMSIGEAVIVPAAVPIGVEVVNPYKGLRPFQEADADDFFGREALVEQLVERLTPSKNGRSRDNRFLAVVGPSGSGKSSVVKAGLIPALREGAIAGSEKWFVAEMVPGTHPLDELELALWPVAVDPPPSLVDPMSRDTRGILRTIRRILPEEEDAQLLLVIDQFEELFTLVEDEGRKAFFIDSLLWAVNAPRTPLRVIITLRADFYDRPLQVQPLAKWIKENTEIALPLTPEELTWAVREPARRVGVGLEEGLSEAIVADVADQPGALPMLQYTLTELFEVRQNNMMTRTAYEEIGGVMGALGSRAEEIFGSLSEAGKDAARQLFLRMVTLGEGVEDTRRRVLKTELEGLGADDGHSMADRGSAIQGNGRYGGSGPVTIEKSSPIPSPQSPIAKRSPSDIPSIIDAFGRARLLTFDRDPVTRGPTVEVAHEALLREWRRLRRWLDESRADVRLQRMLALAAAEWAGADQDPGFLLRDSRLDQFAGWAETSSVALTQDESVFLVSSVTAKEARKVEEEARRQRELETAKQLAQTEKARAEEQAESAGNLRRRAVYLGIALLVAVILAIVAVLFARQSNENASLAEEREIVALSEASQRATAQAQAETEKIRADSERDTAIDAQATAEAERQRADTERDTAQSEAIMRATAESVAIEERVIAEEQGQLAFSRELAAAALDALDEDQELAVLLAIQALEQVHTQEAEDALHRTVQELRLLKTLDAPGKSAWVSISPDGRLLISSADTGAAVWDTATWEILYSIDISEGWINRAAFSPDGAYLVTPNEGSESFVESTVSIYDAETGEELLTFVAHDGWVQDVTFNSDGTLFATAAGDGVAKIWDLAAPLAAGEGREYLLYCPDLGRGNCSGTVDNIPR
jgi:DNA-binding SARP family transcriptional activator/tRNA A-37 threonylcarbamoyl transferase component Bud32